MEALGTEPRTLRKQTLLRLSRVMEDQCLATYGSPQDTVCLVFFQRSLYFGAAQRRMARLSRRTLLHVVAFEGHAGVLPSGLTHVPLNPGEPLAREWTFVVVAPGFGAHIVAVDREQPAAREADRLFDASFSYIRAEAVEQARRVAGALGPRLPGASREALDRIVGTGDRPSPASWSQASLQMVVTSFDIMSSH